MPAAACFAVGAAWATIVAWLIGRAVRQSRAHRQVPAVTWPEAEEAPEVAIVVPARDEALAIGACLTALQAQTYPAHRLQLTVVDDGSRDATAAIVQHHAARDGRVRLLRAGPLPSGWMGKPHACWLGAREADAPWLCFVDADVRASPFLLASAVRAAEAGGLDMLSLQPFLELGSFWERLVIPAGLLMVACAKDLSGVNDPASPEVTANGQFILIRRSAYRAIGGHAAVRREVCEDKALARLIKRQGLALRVLGAEHLAQTRMYRDLASLWSGFSKNAVEIMGNARGTVLAAVGAVLAAIASVGLPLPLGWVAAAHPSPAAWTGFALAMAGSAALLGIQIGTARHFRIPWAYGLLFPLGYLVAAAIALNSVRIARSGRVVWKGRSYSPVR